jgi:hypothetical protein
VIVRVANQIVLLNCPNSLNETMQHLPRLASVCQSILFRAKLADPLKLSDQMRIGVLHFYNEAGLDTYRSCIMGIDTEILF